MVRRSTWILVAVFAVLVVLALLWPRISGGAGTKVVPTFTPAPVLFTFDSSSVQEVKVADQNRSVTLQLDASSVWTVFVGDSLGEGVTDVNRIETILTQLSGIRLLSTIPDATDLEQYGLTVPTYTVTITLTGGEQHTLRIGGKSPANSGYYVRQDGDTTVQVVGQYNLDVLLKLLDNPPLATPTPPTQTSEPTLTVPITATQTLSDTTILTPTVAP